MKKILYTLSMVVAILSTSCSEDRGTSTEVADANENEKVDPDHLNQYDMPGTAGTYSATVPNNDMNQKSAVELVTSYYVDNQPTQYYRLNSTYPMAGMAPATNTAQDADNKTDSTTTVKKSGTTMAPGSTTASGEGRDAVTSKTQTSGEKKATTNKKKTRITPEQ